MPEICFAFPIRGALEAVFTGISTPEGLDAWWTLRARGAPVMDSTCELWFGAAYDWRARVIGCEPNRRFVLELTQASDDWLGTQVGFELEPEGALTHLTFRHVGWRTETPHFRTTAFCWALYLRILRRWLEHGEVVPYTDRLEV